MRVFGFTEDSLNKFPNYDLPRWLRADKPAYPSKVLRDILEEWWGGAYGSAVWIEGATDSLMPSWFCWTLVFLFGLLGLLPRGKAHKRPRFGLEMIAAAAALILFIHYVGFTGVKPLMRSLDRIKPGMTEARVLQVMKGHKSEIYSADANWPYDVIYYRFYDANQGVVQLRKGRVVSVEFHLD